MTTEPRLKRAAGADDLLVGSWAALPHPSVAELLGSVGYDFVALDGEHSSMSYETMEDMLRAVDAAPGETETMVRTDGDDPATLKHVVDLGPTCILVPSVETAAQAESIVDATRYPPEGSRGLGLGRATGYGLRLDEYVDSVEHRLVRFVQLESERAVENAAEIVAVEGIDGVFVGPIDLTLSMGRLGEWDDAAFLEAVERVVESARDAGIAVGTLATDADQRATRLEWGVDFLVAGVDAVHLADGAREALEHCRDTDGSGASVGQEN